MSTAKRTTLAPFVMYPLALRKRAWAQLFDAAWRSVRRAEDWAKRLDEPTGSRRARRLVLTNVDCASCLLAAASVLASAPDEVVFWPEIEARLTALKTKLGVGGGE